MAPNGRIDNTLAPFVKRLEPTMQAAQRGGCISDVQIERETGQPVGRLDGAIRRWFLRQRGIVVQHRGDTYYLLTDAEQARMPQRRIRQARRRYAFGVYEGNAVNATALDVEERGILEHHMRVAAAQLQLATEAMHQTRWTLSGRVVKALTE